MDWNPQSKYTDCLNVLKKQDPTVHCLQETQFKDTFRLKIKEWNKIFCVSSNQKRVGVDILISHKTDFNRLSETKENIILWWQCQFTKKIYQL